MKTLTYLKVGLLFAVVLFYSCSSGGKRNADYSLMPVQQGDKWGFVNTKGEYVINPQFEYAEAFFDGLAKVKVSDKYGFINKEGKYVINPSYSGATSFCEGKAWVVSPKGAPTLVNTKGKVMFTMKSVRRAYNYSEGVAVVIDDNGKAWAIDDNGKTVCVFPQGLKAQSSFLEGLAAVSDENGNYGYIDKKGKIVINCQFREASPFVNGKAIARSGDMYGLIDKNGKYVVNPQFDGMLWDDDKYIVVMGDMGGWCDEKGKIIINPQFEKVFPFGGASLGAVQMGRKFGYIDTKGKIVINPQFECGLSFVDDKVAWVQMVGKWGLIDKEGKFVVNPQFDNIIIPFEIPTMESVVSEYFDIEGIVSWVVSKLDGNKFDGMTVTQTSISAFRKKYGIGDRETVYGNVYSLDLNYEIAANGTFTETVSDGWWGTTTKQLPNAKIESIKLSLTPTDYENCRPLFDALVKALGGVNGKRSSGQYVAVADEGNEVDIYVSDKQFDTTDLYNMGCGE